MRNLIQDIRYASRALARNPGFAGAAVLTIALGVGANTAVFSVVHAVLWRPLPFREPQRLVVIWEDLFRDGNHRFSVAAPNYEDLRAQGRSLEDVAAQMPRGANLTGGAAAEPSRGAGVSGNYFGLLGAARTKLPLKEHARSRMQFAPCAERHPRIGDVAHEPAAEAEVPVIVIGEIRREALPGLLGRRGDVGAEQCSR